MTLTQNIRKHTLEFLTLLLEKGAKITLKSPCIASLCNQYMECTTHNGYSGESFDCTPPLPSLIIHIIIITQHRL